MNVPLVICLAVAMLQDASWISLRKFQVTAEEEFGQDADSNQTLRIGAMQEPDWRLARTEFEISGDEPPGSWILHLGPAALVLAVQVNGTEVTAEPDRWADDPELALGGVFLIAPELLRSGTNELVCRRVSDTGRLTAGPAQLLPPPLAAEFLTLCRQAPGVAQIANDEVIAAGASLDLAARFAIRETSTEFRLAGLLSMSLLLNGEGPVAVRDLELAARLDQFPQLSVKASDPLYPHYEYRSRLIAPLQPAGAEFGELLGIVGNRLPNDPAAQSQIRLQFFPAVGGELNFRKADRYVLLHNDRVALYAEAPADVLGTEDSPTGLAITFGGVATGGRRGMSLAGPEASFGILEVDPNADLSELRQRVRAQIRDDLQRRAATREFAERWLATPESFADLHPQLVTQLGPALTKTAMAPSSVEDWSTADLSERMLSNACRRLHYPQGDRQVLQAVLDTEVEGRVLAKEDGSDAQLTRNALTILWAVESIRWHDAVESYAQWQPTLQALSDWSRQQECKSASAAILRLAAMQQLRDLDYRLAEAPATELSERTTQVQQAVEEQWLPVLLQDSETADSKQARRSAVLFHVFATEPHELLQEKLRQESLTKDDSAADFLLLRSLLHSGMVTQALPGVRATLQKALQEPDLAHRAYQLIWDCLGAGRPQRNTLSIVPRLSGEETVQHWLPIDEGVLRFQWQPQYGRRKQVRFHNDTKTPFHVGLQIPLEIDDNSAAERSKKSHEFDLEPGQILNEVLR